MRGYTNYNRFIDACDNLLIANIDFLTMVYVTAKGRLNYFIINID